MEHVFFFRFIVFLGEIPVCLVKAALYTLIKSSRITRDWARDL